MALGGLGALGCGRPATQAECEEIVERVVRLHLEATRRERPESMAGEVAEFKERVRERTRSACVGKPVTARALACAREASDVDALEDCFR